MAAIQQGPSRSVMPRPSGATRSSRVAPLGVCALAWVLLLCGLPIAAQAHKPSDSYLRLRVEGTAIRGEWDIAIRDLDFAIGLDTNGDGEVTWGELRRRQPAIASYALAHLALLADGAPCALRPLAHLVDRHTDGAYEVLRFSTSCPRAATALTVRYSLFFDLDPQHKGLLNLATPEGVRTAIFAVTDGEQRFDLHHPGRALQFLQFCGEGVFHIFQGLDHILFLLSLLLPAVLVRRDHAWQPVTRLAEAFWEVLRVVTAFTAAHSITLSLATLGVITLPSRWVESAIAASVVFAALGNIFACCGGRRWVLAFGFGLIHGFGFAAVLSDLGLPRNVLVPALVGFNLGVEAGQIAIVAAFLPVAFALRDTWFYRRATLLGGSLLIALVAGGWFAERAFRNALF